MSQLTTQVTDVARDASTLIGSGMLKLLDPRGAVPAVRALVTGAPKVAALGALHAGRAPHATALIHDGRSISWLELNNRVERLTRVFGSIGIGPSAGVAIMCTNRPEFLEAQQAGLMLGAQICFISPRATQAQTTDLMKRVDCKVLVTTRDDISADFVIRTGTEYETALKNAPSEKPTLTKGSGRVVIFTSGTTGRPKGAVRNLDSAANAKTFAGFLRAVPFKGSDRHLVVCPMYHSSGSGFASASLALGNALVLCEHFSATEFCRLVAEHKVTTTALVPTMLQEIIRVAPNYDLSSLRVVVCTGSPLRESVRREARETIGDVIYDLYGSTEMGWVSVASPADQRIAPGSVGKPVGGIEVRIAGPNGEEAKVGETGEIWARSKVLMESYLDDDQLNKDRVRDGFVCVGDVGYVDKHGYLYCVDRSDDMIISGGINVYPAETEVALMSHPSVSDAAAFGVADDQWGHKVVAAVVADSGTSPDELIEWTKKHASYAAIPKEIRILAKLPRNEIGKTDKRELVRLWT